KPGGECMHPILKGTRSVSAGAPTSPSIGNLPAHAVQTPSPHQKSPAINHSAPLDPTTSINTDTYTKNAKMTPPGGAAYPPPQQVTQWSSTRHAPVTPTCRHIEAERCHIPADRHRKHAKNPLHPHANPVKNLSPTPKPRISSATPFFPRKKARNSC